MKLLPSVFVSFFMVSGVFSNDGQNTYTKDGLVYEQKTGTLYNGIIYSRYPDGKVKEEFTYANGEKNGPYTWRYKSGNIGKKGFIDKGMFSGEYRSLAESGETITLEHYTYNILNGKYIKYNSTGGIQWCATMKNGRINGPKYIYFKNGKIKEKCSFDSGFKYGEEVKYFEKGSIKSRTNFDAGKPHGDYENYYEDGKLKEKGKYFWGQKHGPVLKYNDIGKLTTQERYMNGKCYQTITYDNNGQITKNEADKDFIYNINNPSVCGRSASKVEFDIPKKQEAFLGNDYYLQAAYPFYQKWFGYNKELREHPLFIPLCQKKARILNKNLYPRYIAMAKELTANNQADIISTLFLFNTERNYWKPKEWSRRLAMCYNAADRKSILPYYILYARAVTGKRPVQDDRLRKLLISFMAKNVLSKRDQQYIFRIMNLDSVKASKYMNSIKKINDKNTWIKKTLSGLAHISLAWEARGSSLAYKVKKKNWVIFNQHIKEARKELTSAWELHKDLPEPASKMLTVSKTACSIDESIIWFNRAVWAQADYCWAYGEMTSSLLPRWGGSIELLLKLGDSCFDSGLYNRDITLNIPLKMLIFYQCAASEMDRYKWQNIYKTPGLITKIDKVIYNNMIENGSGELSDRKNYTATLGLFEFYSGNCKRAAEIVNEVGKATFAANEEWMLKKRRYLIPDWIKVHEIIDLYTGSFSEKILAAERYALNDEPESALQIIEKLLQNKQIKGKHREHLVDLYGRYSLGLKAYYYQDFSTLVEALGHNQYQLANKLIQFGADIEKRGIVGRTPLFIQATMHKRLTGVKLLLKYGAETNIRDQYDSTPLCTIAGKNRPDIVACLLKSGAKVDMRGRGVTPLMNALYHKQFANVKLLVEAGADVNAKVGKYRVWDYVLHAKNPEITEYMKKHGAKMTSKRYPVLREFIGNLKNKDTQVTISQGIEGGRSLSHRTQNLA